MGTNSFQNVLQEMVTFVRVAEQGSFSRAAILQNMTPSAVSRQVSRLETELGVQLIHRTTRQLRLTDAGVEAFNSCQELVAAAQATMQITQRHMQTPKGKVRISAPKAFAKHMLHPHILTFLAKYPEVDIHLMVHDRDIDPIRENVDLVIRLTTEPPQGFVARVLTKVDHILVATPAYLAQHKPIEHPGDLIGHSCLYLGEREHDNHWRFTQADERIEVVVHGRYTANHSEIRLDGVLAHLGVGCVPDFIAHDAIEAKQAVQVLPHWTFEAAYRGLAYMVFVPNRFQVPKIRVLIDHFMASLSAYECL
jgi:DNA-binding transcriptional LysR family regulator